MPRILNRTLSQNQVPSLPAPRKRNTMAQNKAGNIAEKALGHEDQSRAATTDISNPARDGGKYADPSGERMKALVWMGKNDVRVRRLPQHQQTLPSA
jgi:hypothetical protein